MPTDLLSALAAVVEIAATAERDGDGVLTNRGREDVRTALSFLDCTRSVGPSPLRERKSFAFSVKEFVRKKDKLGRNYCTDDGKRVPCGGKPAAVPKKPAAAKPVKPPPKPPPKPKEKKPTLDEVRRAVADAKATGLTEANVLDIVALIGKLTVKDIHELRKEIGGRTTGKKAELVESIKLRLQLLIQKQPPPKPPEVVKPPEPEKPKAPEVEKTQTIDLMQKHPDDPVAKTIRADAASHDVVRQMSGMQEVVKTATAKVKRANDLWDASMNAKDKHEQMKLRSEWASAFLEAKEAKASIEKSRVESRKKLLELLKPKNPPELGVKYSEGEKKYQSNEWLFPPFKPNEYRAGLIDEGVAFVRSVTEGKDFKHDITFRQARDNRASFLLQEKTEEIPATSVWGRLTGKYTEKKTITPTISVGDPIDKESGIKTVVHEIGHMIDDMKPGAREKVLAFLDYRVRGETPVDMGTIPGGETMKGEMVRKDDFDRYFNGVGAYYVGKEYRDRKTGEVFGTEIVSMGLEALYRDPAGFCAADPEYAQFVIGILRM